MNPKKALFALLRYNTGPRPKEEDLSGTIRSTIDKIILLWMGYGKKIWISCLTTVLPISEKYTLTFPNRSTACWCIFLRVPIAFMETRNNCWMIWKNSKCWS